MGLFRNRKRPDPLPPGVTKWLTRDHTSGKMVPHGMESPPFDTKKNKRDMKKVKTARKQAKKKGWF